jgi:hypothetical protein
LTIQGLAAVSNWNSAFDQISSPGNKHEEDGAYGMTKPNK